MSVSESTAKWARLRKTMTDEARQVNRLCTIVLAKALPPPPPPTEAYVHESVFTADPLLFSTSHSSFAPALHSSQTPLPPHPVQPSNYGPLSQGSSGPPHNNDRVGSRSGTVPQKTGHERPRRLADVHRQVQSSRLSPASRCATTTTTSRGTKHSNKEPSGAVAVHWQVRSPAPPSSVASPPPPTAHDRLYQQRLASSRYGRWSSPDQDGPSGRLSSLHLVRSVRTPQEKQRGVEIEERNARAVQSPSRWHNVRVQTGVVRALSREHLHRAATSATAERLRHKQHVDEIMKPQEREEIVESRLQASHATSSIEDGILRMCGWCVTMTVARFGQCLAAQRDRELSLQQVQATRIRDALGVLQKNLRPALRRWIRNIRLRKLTVVLLVGFFVIKGRALHRERATRCVHHFLSAIQADRVFAMVRMHNIVRRCKVLFRSMVIRKKALRVVLHRQWQALESVLLLFHFDEYFDPEIRAVSAECGATSALWNDETARLRYKLQQLWASSGAAAFASRRDSLDDERADPVLALNGLESRTAAITASPALEHLAKLRLWRAYYRRHRPVGIYEDSPDSLPISLATFRCPADIRTAYIDHLLNQEYDFLRRQVLDEQVHLRTRLRNFEELCERQVREQERRVRSKFPYILPQSRLFEVVVEYECERKKIPFTSLQVERMRRQIRASSECGFRDTSSSSSGGGKLGSLSLSASVSHRSGNNSGGNTGGKVLHPRKRHLFDALSVLDVVREGIAETVRRHCSTMYEERIVTAASTVYPSPSL